MTWAQRAEAGVPAEKFQSALAAKPAKKTKLAIKAAPAANSPATRSKAARAHIAEGTRLFALAGRPTKAQFVKVYGAKDRR